MIINAKPYAYDNTIVINFCTYIRSSKLAGRFHNTSTSTSIALKLLATILAQTFELFMIERMIGGTAYTIFTIY